MRVWIDQDLCTGDGICEEICGDVFTARDDGLWVVKEEAKHFGSTLVFDGQDGDGHGPDGGRGVARIPDSLIDSAVEAAEEVLVGHGTPPCGGLGFGSPAKSALKGRFTAEARWCW